MKKLLCIAIPIVAFIALFVCVFIIGFFGLANETESQVVETGQFPVGRYAVMGVSLYDTYNVNFLILDTATGQYKIINVVTRSAGKIEITKTIYGQVE